MSKLQERIDCHEEMIGLLIKERESTQRQIDRELALRNKLRKIKTEAENFIKYGTDFAISATSVSEFRKYLGYFTEHAEELENEDGK